jgi:Cd2+/Zn2+-exporting ATPase
MMNNPRQRRLALVLASGGLIAAALAAGRLPGAGKVGDALMAAAAVLAGWDIARRAFTSLRNRYVSIELLVTIATAGALVIGEYWEAAAVTFLFIFGAYLEAVTLSRTRQVIGGLLDLAPTTATVVRLGRQVEVLPHEIDPGEIVWVKPGAKIAVDGEVVEGQSAVDESAITGEPMPEDKAPGAAVYAGTLNGSGLLKVRATGVGADTTLARIIRRVEEAQEEKAPTQRFIERFARWYTPAIIALSAVVFLLSRDIELALTLLVIGCPGALVISTPVSVVAGIGRSARAGILIKGGEYLENAGKISALALDKTGTLTQGKPKVTDVVALAEPVSLNPQVAVEVLQDASWSPPVYSGFAESSDIPNNVSPWSPAQSAVLYWAAIAEAGSEHPLARAILEAAHAAFPGPLPEAESFEALAGKGVRAELAGRSIIVGTPEWLNDQGIPVDPPVVDSLAGLKSEGRTAVLVALDGEVAGLLGISDPIRPTAPLMLQRLRAAGLKRIVMLTGDDPITAQAIARQAGIEEVRAGLLPEDKLQAIRGLQAEGHVVAMVGDGINDAPALAAADIGIAMGAAGTGLAIETADIALMADDLLKIPEAVRLSKAALGSIRQNVLIALATVSALLLGVLLGRVHMAGGMLIHEASVLIVIFNAMRLLRIKT